jgi:hypothetical protein
VDVHYSSSRAGAAAAVTALLLCTSLAAADAASSAQATSAPVTVSSGSWGAVADMDGAAPYALTPLELNFPNGGSPGQGNLKNQSALFAVINIGSLGLTAAEYTVTSSGAAPFSLDACSVAWTQRDNSCPGQLTVLTNTSLPSISSVVPSAPGSTLWLRAALTGSAPINTKITISIKVTRAQVRAASVTGS